MTDTKMEQQVAPISARIVSSAPSSDGTFNEFVISIERPGEPPSEIRHRYSAFRELHATIASPLHLPPFAAPRRLFPARFGNMDQRKRLLQEFLDQASAAAAKTPSAQLAHFLNLSVGAEAAADSDSPVYDPCNHSLWRKQCIAFARPTDNASNITS